MTFTLHRSSSANLPAIVAFTALILGTGVGAGDQGEDSVEKLSEQVEAASEALDETRFFVMPTPISNPTIGTGLGVATMQLFDVRENAPPSHFMVGGFWADSKSWAGGVGGEAHFTDDVYRLSGWLGYFDVNLKFYGIGNEAGDRGKHVEINQKGPFFAPRLLRRVSGKLYLGAQLRYVTVTTAFTNLPDWLPGNILRDGIKVKSSGLGLVAEYDGRDYDFKPTSGSLPRADHQLRQGGARQ